MKINETILDYYLQGETPAQISRLMNIPRDEVAYQITNAYKQHLIPLDSKKRLAQSFLANGYTYEQIANELDMQVSSVLSATFSVSPDKRKTISKETEKKIVEAYLKGETYTSIKKAYNVCYPTIKKLCRGLPKPEIPLSQIKVIEEVKGMKQFNKLEEMEKYLNAEKGAYIFIENRKLLDIKITFNLTVKEGIIARNIEALDITASFIKARCIDAWNINTRKNITSSNINAMRITTRDINAWNIEAINIEACHIKFYAVCFTYENIECKSIISFRRNSRYFSLDGEVIIKEK